MPDSCCKTVVTHCGQRTHPSNIYKVEVSAQAPAEAHRGPRHPGSPEGRAQVDGLGKQSMVSIGSGTTVGPSKGPTELWGQTAATGHRGVPPSSPQVTHGACGQLEGWVRPFKAPIIPQ